MVIDKVRRRNFIFPSLEISSQIEVLRDFAVYLTILKLCRQIYRSLHRIGYSLLYTL